MSTREPYILFEVAGTTYALPSRLIQQVDMIEQVTPVPNAPPGVDGLVLSRGQIIPALNLRVQLGFERRSYDGRSRLVVVQRQGRTVGLVVDSAREFLWLTDDQLQPPPEGIPDASRRTMAAVAALGERLIVLLDLDEALAAATLPDPRAVVQSDTPGAGA
jgi:purine-binding chemotaxis protein CheW